MSHFTTIRVELNPSLILRCIQEDPSFRSVSTNKNKFYWDYNLDPHRQILLAGKMPYGKLSVEIDKNQIHLSGDSDYLRFIQKKLSLLQVMAKIKENPNLQSVNLTKEGLQVIDWTGNKTQVNLVAHGVEIEPVMAGDGCLAVTASLEQSLGEVTSRKFKDPNADSTVHLAI